ncbi:MAG: hypothetical protein IT438_13290 [Phycisphaerales bacterium]|nr:hypothetical protein [Phycisphaerales bacterium]
MSAPASNRNPWQLACLSMLALAGAALLGGQTQPSRSPYIGVCASEKILYRVYEDGRVDYLVTEKAPSSGKGAADWAPLPVDGKYTRDRDGNVVPKR